MSGNENWGAEEWRQPVPAEGDTVLFAEHGRILPGSGDGSIIGRGVDCRSHSFKLVRPRYGRGVDLLVRHGGGDERFEVDHSGRIVAAFEPLDSDARYWLLHTLHNLHRRAADDARTRTANRYAQAFAEGRLKKRRRNGRVFVEIAEPAVAAEADGAIRLTA